LLEKPNNPALAIVLLSGLYLILTSTFTLFNSLTDFDAKRLLQLLLFTAVMIIAVAWAPLRNETVKQLDRLSTLARWLLASFFALGLVSSLSLDHPGYALVDVSMMFIMMVLIAVTAGSRELSGRHFDQWAVVLLSVLGLAVCIQEIMGYVAGWVMGSEFNYTQAFIHFAHPRFYNQLQTWSIPVIAALPLVFPDKRWIKFGCVILLGLQWFLVITIAARGTVVSLFIAMIFISLWLPAQRKFWVKYQLAGLLCGGVIYTFILFLNGVFIPQTQSGEFYAHSLGRPLAHTSGRSMLWRLSVEDAIKHPVLGAGPTRYACDTERTLPAHPHSFPLRILGEWGVIAALLLLFLAIHIGLGFLNHLRHSSHSNQKDPPLKAILAICLIAGFVHACLSGLLIMPASQVAMILIAGWTLSLCGNNLVTPQYPVKASLLLLTALLLSLAILGFVGKEIPLLPQRTSYAQLKGPTVPRFWLNGRVCDYRYVVQWSESDAPNNQ